MNSLILTLTLTLSFVLVSRGTENKRVKGSQSERRLGIA